MKNKIITILFSAILPLLFSSCATERFVTPVLDAGPRQESALRAPVLAAVFDARTQPEPPDAAAGLQSALTRIYGSGFEWSHAAESSPGRVSLQIKIRALGAFYGKRLISMKEYTESLRAAHEKASGTWDPVLEHSSGRQSVLAEILPAEGWWNGVAWLDLEIEDNRGPQQVRFVLPIAAEHREAGRGSESGDRAALAAWQRASSRLLLALDAVVQVMKQDEH